MGRRLHSICTSVMTLALAATLAHCGSDGGGAGGGGGGGRGIQLFFGIVGDGSCSNVVVNVDLAGANAVLARLEGGAPHCSLDPILTSNGCSATFTEIGLGDRLQVAIGGCTIPAVTNLFQCFFTAVDEFDITSETIAQCSCSAAGCDGGPPVCVDRDSDPRSCEDCDNRIDDDDDGLEDCEDPNCRHAPECAATTTTTGNVSSTSTSLGETTTTSLPPGPIEINFILAQTVEPLGALQFTVNYTSAPGRFVGDGEDVECTPNVEAAFAANASDATSKLTLGFVSIDGIDDPQPLATCLFEPDTPVPVPANFTIVIDDAADTEGNRVRNVIVETTVTGVPIN